jgi:hypothetical protein
MWSRALKRSVKWEWTMLLDNCVFCWQKKEGRIWFNIVCFKFCQFERIIWWCLFVMESILGCVLKFALQYVRLEKISKKVMVSRNLRHVHLLEAGLMENSKRPWNVMHSPPCRTPCRLFTHEVFFGPLGLHLRVWSELGWSPPFQPMRALRLQWSWAFSLVCEVALRSSTSRERSMSTQPLMHALLYASIYTLNTVVLITHVATKVHMILRSFVVLTWMRHTIKLV